MRYRVELLLRDDLGRPDSWDRSPLTFDDRNMAERYAVSIARNWLRVQRYVIVETTEDVPHGDLQLQFSRRSNPQR